MSDIIKFILDHLSELHSADYIILLMISAIILFFIYKLVHKLFHDKFSAQSEVLNLKENTIAELRSKLNESSRSMGVVEAATNNKPVELGLNAKNEDAKKAPTALNVMFFYALNCQRLAIAYRALAGARRMLNNEITQEANEFEKVVRQFGNQLDLILNAYADIMKGDKDDTNEKILQASCLPILMPLGDEIIIKANHLIDTVESYLKK